MYRIQWAEGTRRGSRFPGLVHQRTEWSKLMLTRCPLSKQPAGLQKRSQAASALVREVQRIPDGCHLVFKQSDFLEERKRKICIQVTPNTSPGISSKVIALTLPGTCLTNTDYFTARLSIPENWQQAGCLLRIRLKYFFLLSIVSFYWQYTAYSMILCNAINCFLPLISLELACLDLSTLSSL